LSEIYLADEDVLLDHSRRLRDRLNPCPAVLAHSKRRHERVQLPVMVTTLIRPTTDAVILAEARVGDDLGMSVRTSGLVRYEIIDVLAVLVWGATISVRTFGLHSPRNGAQFARFAFTNVSDKLTRATEHVETSQVA
jgi:hypothetical protein